MLFEQLQLATDSAMRHVQLFSGLTDTAKPGSAFKGAQCIEGGRSRLMICEFS